MMRVYLIEKCGSRKLDLGNSRFNDKEAAIGVMRRRHPFIGTMQTNGFAFECIVEKGPYRKEVRVNE